MLAGACHETGALASPGEAVTAVGARGAPTGVAAAVRDDAGPVPAAVTARTAKVYARVLSRPRTTALVAVPLKATGRWATDPM